MICAIVTAAGGFPSDPSDPQYKARTDARIEVLKEAKWFRVPYPGEEKRYITSVVTGFSYSAVLTF